MRPLVEALAVLAAALAGLGGLLRYAPGYLLSQGFPVDDAWTHAVYARALATSGLLAFNPGVPGPGVASPLWVALVAAVHLLAQGVDAVIPATKLAGFVLHAAAALVLLRALTAAGVGVAERLLGAGVVALHPDLIAGATSGLEIPLAALGVSGLLWAIGRERAWEYALASAAVALLRADLAVLSFALPLAAITPGDRTRLARFLGAAVAGSLGMLALLFARELAVAGSLVPAVSLAAVDSSVLDALVAGFRDLLGQVPVTDSSLLLLLAAATALVALRSTAEGRLPAAGFLAGLAFCGVSFLLHPPMAHAATGIFGLADQRHVLPVLPLIAGTLPAVLRQGAALGLSSRVLPVLRWGLAALLLVSVAVHAPRRHVLLASDARSIDELQVAAGRALASAPSQEVIWAIFPGAIRYFGSAEVVDLSGANTPELRGDEAPRFLAAHAPRYIEVVPGRSELDPTSRSRVRAVRFETRPRESWTGPLPGEERWLILCAEPGARGQLRVDHRVFDFQCAGGAVPPATAPTR